MYIYQLIQLIIDYTKFKMNNEYQVRNYIEEITITLCFDEKKILFTRNLIHVAGVKTLIRKDDIKIKRRYYHGKYCYTYIYSDYEEYMLSHNYTKKLRHEIGALNRVKTYQIVFMKYP